MKTRVKPRLLSDSAYYDVASHICQALACHVIGSILNPRVILSKGLFGRVEPVLHGPGHWGRFAELSADRASLLVAQDASVVVSAIMKMAAGRGVHSCTSQLNLSRPCHCIPLKLPNVSLKKCSRQGEILHV
jgi:hypothetical protein